MDNKVKQNEGTIEKPTSGMAIAAVILGILSCSICVFGGAILGVTGVVLAVLSYIYENSAKQMAIIGGIVSLVGFILGLIALIWWMKGIGL